MCRVAGRRCPCDSSDARRMRRLAEKVRTGISESSASLQQSSVGVLETLERDSFGRLVNAPEDGFGEGSAIVQETREKIEELQELQELIRVAFDRRKLDYDDEEAVARANAASEELKKRFGKADKGGISPVDAHEEKVREVGQAIATIAEGRGAVETNIDFLSAVDAEIGEERLAELKEERNKAFGDVQTAAQEALEHFEQIGVTGDFLDYEGEHNFSIDMWVARDNLVEISETGMADTTLGFSARNRLRDARQRLKDGEGEVSPETQAMLDEAATMVSDVWNKQSAALDADKGVEKERQKVRGAIYERRGEIYKQVLADVSKHSFGGEFKVSDKSDKDAMEAVNAAADCYPAHWIAKSNATTNELRVKHTNRRAHYRSLQSYKSRSGLALVREYTTSDTVEHAQSMIALNSEGRSKGLRQQEYRILTEEEKSAAGKGDVAGVVVERQEYNYAHIDRKITKRKWGSSERTRDHASPWRTEFQRPEGNGWEPVQFEIEHGRYDDETGKHVTEMITVNSWRRPRKAMQEKSVEYNAELLVDGAGFHNKGGTKPAGYPTAIHELAHRMEDVSGSDVVSLENAFLERRATKEDGDVEEQTLIYGQRKGANAEIGYRDSFVSHYMGKTYNGRYFEVMSTGMEAVFAGEYGGLLGGDGHKADHDHRNFVLGVLANG